MNRTEDRRWGRAKLLRHGQLLRRLREDAGLSQREVCEQIGLSTTQFSDIERGVAPLSLRRANQIAHVIGSSCTEIVQAVLQDRLEDAGFVELRVSIAAEPEVTETNGHRPPATRHG